jgi:hypothetical protein
MKIKHLLLIILHICVTIYFIPTFIYAFDSTQQLGLIKKFGWIHSVFYLLIFLLNLIILSFLTGFTCISIYNIFTGELEIPFLTKFLNKKIT